MNWKKFRKKPVVIEAVQWDPDIMKWSDFPETRVIDNKGRLSGIEERYDSHTARVLTVMTIEGMVVAQPGDWVIRGILSEFYPVKPDIFEMTYEEVDSDSEDDPLPRHLLSSQPIIITYEFQEPDNTCEEVE